MYRSADIYITYKCNLRCSHCFIGNKLNNHQVLPFSTVKKIINYCAKEGIKSIAFLGGEPTTYPLLSDAVNLCFSMNIECSIVTNGLETFAKFINIHKGNILPSIAFSVDGFDNATYKKMRNNNRFEELTKNIIRCGELGYTCRGVISLNNKNIDNIEKIIEFTDSYNLVRLNVHYITNRGFAKKEDVVSPSKWLDVYEKVKKVAQKVDLDIRFEKTFYRKTNIDCHVQDESNLIFYPDGKVSFCPMFVDIDDSNPYIFEDGKLIKSNSFINEKSICKTSNETSCPAIKFINPNLAEWAKVNNYSIGCIFDKEEINR